jgi:3-hydroxyacyl-CoA dehydrogenase
MTRIEKVTVLGTGVLGSQIAFQAAFHGFPVTAYDVSDDAVAAGRERFEKLAKRYAAEPAVSATSEQTAAALDRLHLTTDLGEAAASADLVIEAVPEVIDIKRELYARLADVAPRHTIFATNSSTLLPSDFKESTGRPDRFLALHYANEIWRANTAEVMGTVDTDPEVFDAVVDFATRSGMVPIELRKEKAGYVVNSLLVPFLSAAAELLVGGYAEVETIDKTWRIATGAPLGPFQIYDIIGLTTPYNIAKSDPSAGSQALAGYLKTNYIDKGKLGVATGEGFYRH